MLGKRRLSLQLLAEPTGFPLNFNQVHNFDCYAGSNTSMTRVE
jgi:hypothetical protein